MLLLAVSKSKEQPNKTVDIDSRLSVLFKLLICVDVLVNE